MPRHEIPRPAAHIDLPNTDGASLLLFAACHDCLCSLALRPRKVARHNAWHRVVTGIIFVVDSNDRELVSEARDELQRMLRFDELRDARLLVFANKQDLPNAMSVPEITEKLGLHALRQRTWHIQSTCAMSGEGLYEGLEWLGIKLKRKF